MTSDIKQRIEQINRGEVPQGYKKTEVGIVPREWAVTKLLDITVDGISNGIFNDPLKVGGDTLLVNVINLYDEPHIKINNLSKLTVSEKELLQYKVEKYDIFFTRSSLKLEGIAHCNMITEDISNTVYDCHIMKIKPNQNIVNPFFLCKILKFKDVRRQFMLKAKTTTMTTIGQKDIADVLLYIPKITEQQTIAKILAKWDEAIELQESLIAKLEEQKKALMQKLLTPKEGWKIYKVGELTKEVSLRNKNNRCTNIKSVSNKNGFINQDEQFTKQVASKDTSNYKLVKQGNIAYNPSRINVGSIALYDEIEAGIVSPMYVVFKCIDIDPRMLLLSLSTARGKYNIESYLSGSVRESLNYSDLKEIEIPLPNKDIQKKIVVAFQFIENYTSAENKLLSKLKQQQKALQQLLLTGIVRV